VYLLGLARRLRSLAILGLVAYVVVLLVSPVLHHDLACHLKTPGHCDACAASPLASRAETAAASTPPRLDGIGMVEAGEMRAARHDVRLFGSERAPPPAASA
jgi:hypothetical protein